MEPKKPKKLRYFGSHDGKATACVGRCVLKSLEGETSWSVVNRSWSVNNISSAIGTAVHCRVPNITDKQVSAVLQGATVAGPLRPAAGTVHGMLQFVASPLH